MSDQAPAGDPATPEQMAELRRLAAGSDEEIPNGMLASEAEQRLVELRSADSAG